MTAEQLNKKMDGLSEFIGKFIQEWMKRNEAYVLTLEREQLSGKQQGVGVNVEDKQIGKYKSVSYKRQRQKAGRQIAFIDLRFSGDFYKGLTLFLKTGFNRGNGEAIWEFGAKDKEFLAEKYPSILGLTEMSMVELTDAILDDLFIGLKRYFA
jgi:hypothetical protein